jgi:hypothetical protein
MTQPATLISPIPHMRATLHSLLHQLRALLPPFDGTPKARLERDMAVVEQFSSLQPASAQEAAIAARYIAAGLQSLEALRMSRDPEASRQERMRCIAQSATMMRQSRALMRELIQARAEREALAEDPSILQAAAEAQAALRHSLTEALAEAQPDAPPQERVQHPAALAPAEAKPQAGPGAASTPAAADLLLTGGVAERGWLNLRQDLMFGASHRAMSPAPGHGRGKRFSETDPRRATILA